MSVLHQYIIEDGQVSYRNRFLDSDTYRRNTAANRIVMSEFGVVGYSDPCKSLFTRYFSYFFGSKQITDNDCVNVMLLGDQLYALSETHLINKIDPVSLDRIEKVNWHKYVAVHMATAHPMMDADGTTYNIGTHVSSQSSYKIIRIPPAQPSDNNPVRSATIAGSIPTQWQSMPCYSHSFGITQNYVIFIEQPLAVNFLELTTGRLTGKAFFDSLHFYDGYKTKFHVLNKATGSLVEHRFVAEQFFVFHHINAYEEDDQIVVDVSAYRDTAIIKSLSLESIRNHNPFPLAIFRRYVLPLNVNKHGVNLVTIPYTTAKATALDDGTVFCEPESIPDAYLELPRVHYEKYNGNKYRYAYGVQMDGCKINKLIQIDIVNKTMTYWSEDDYFPGDPVFVPDPDGIEEDDGVILSPVIRLNDDLQSFLLVLDAKTFTEVARAQVPADIDIPMTFHGIFTDTK